MFVVNQYIFCSYFPFLWQSRFQRWAGKLEFDRWPGTNLENPCFMPLGLLVGESVGYFLAVCLLLRSTGHKKRPHHWAQGTILTPTPAKTLRCDWFLGDTLPHSTRYHGNQKPAFVREQDLSVTMERRRISTSEEKETKTWEKWNKRTNKYTHKQPKRTEITTQLTTNQPAPNKQKRRERIFFNVLTNRQNLMF